ncbi:hypothetical protein O1611_g925 [Lasiodiplodia mahajangana]|uniref:Uncharacterized protein n=1 Tax=Lasiodiplodia mahajangana TaxID=1108764 RepID=A0ACC2JYU3_9PEZI|nr:hypothetical protein O1611_g925 [Lasiodiplodia mahajangana]
MLTNYKIFVCGPLALFQATKPLLQKSSNPRWFSISSIASSIGMIKQMRTDLTPAYGPAKSALNWLTQGIYAGNEWLTTICIHPGLVQTGPGNWVARQIGMKEAPYTIEQAVTSIMKLSDEGKRETHSGKLIFAIDGTDMPW